MAHDDTGNAADSSRPGGSVLSQQVLGLQAQTGGHAVGSVEGQRPSFDSPSAGVLFGGSSHAVVPVGTPLLETARVGGNVPKFAPKSRGSRLSRNGVPKYGLRSGHVDWRENTAVGMGSVLGQGSLSGQQAGRTGSESATIAGSNPVPLQVGWSSLGWVAKPSSYVATVGSYVASVASGFLSGLSSKSFDLICLICNSFPEFINYL